jgi:hypothetical protein
MHLSCTLTSTGDRFHFESEAAGFTDEEKDILRNTKLSDIIFRHTSLQAVQCSVFYNTPAYALSLSLLFFYIMHYWSPIVQP